MGKTILLDDVVTDFILSGKYPRSTTLTTSDVVASMLQAFRPDLTSLMTSKRVAYLLAHHRWIDRVCLSSRRDVVQRYIYQLSDDAIDEINERIRKQDRIL